MTRLHYSPSLGRLARCTSEKCPFEHFDEASMKRMAPVTLQGSLKTFKHSYVGILVQPQLVAPAVSQLRSAMTPGLLTTIMEKKARRDGEDQYHMTVLSPSEYRRLKNAGKLELPERPFRFELMGVGTAVNEKSQTWFAVAKSPVIDHFRYGLGLPRKDLHVTLGFAETDVHGVPKDESTLI